MKALGEESPGKGMFTSQKQNKQVRLQSNFSFWLWLIKTHMHANAGRTTTTKPQHLPSCINLFIQKAPPDPEQHPIQWLCSAEFLSHVNYRHPIWVACKVNHLYVKFMQTRKPKQLFSSTNYVKYKQRYHLCAEKTAQCWFHTGVTDSSKLNAQGFRGFIWS